MSSVDSCAVAVRQNEATLVDGLLVVVEWLYKKGWAWCDSKNDKAR